MWTMTKRGFYSVVAHRDDPSRVLVRSRCERDIRALKDLVPDEEPFYMAYADYHWRLECSSDEWVRAVSVMAAEIDYPNFKSAITDQAHHHAYMDVWHALLPLADSTGEPSPSNRPELATKPESNPKQKRGIEELIKEMEEDPNCYHEPGDPEETSLTFITEASPRQFGLERFHDLEMPDMFDLEVPYDESPTGWILDVGALTPDLFDRFDDGTYLCAGYGGHPIYLRVVEKQDGGVIKCVDGGGEPFLYRISALAG